ncbi:MAG: hypothetical protein RSE13_02710 [Planktothrix sp. GU0601_MAG3]|nr:MAG: hypothetical protein RSE13_02710 [Planktothrix sp. GU0601_MAG3]
MDKRLKNDLRIAAIALSVNGVMVTANKRDFSLIPDLVIENWTDPSILLIKGILEEREFRF